MVRTNDHHVPIGSVSGLLSAAFSARGCWSILQQLGCGVGPSLNWDRVSNGRVRRGVGAADLYCSVSAAADFESSSSSKRSSRCDVWVVPEFKSNGQIEPSLQE